MSEAMSSGSTSRPQAIVFDNAATGHCARQTAIEEMLIDMDIWYPNEVYRSPVLNSGKYWRCASAPRLPSYVVPPRFWPGINCPAFYKALRSATTESSTLYAGDSNQGSEDSQPAEEHDRQEDTGLSVEESNSPNGHDPNPATANNDSPSQEQPPQAAPQPPVNNYNGDLTNPFNQSADIPDSENCSVFITELPVHLTYQQLFDSIRDVGKIAHCHINGATPPHRGTAAKIVFFDRVAVDRLLAQLAAGRFTVGARRPKIALNRVRAAATPAGLARASRVLDVYGPAPLVTTARLRALWESHGLSYDLECAVVALLPNNVVRLQFRFASCRAQALRARAILLAEKRRREQDAAPNEVHLWGLVRVEWGTDPCARVTGGGGA